MFDDAFGDAVLARGIAAFEDDEELAVLSNDVALELHEFDLQGVELVLVFPVRDLRQGAGAALFFLLRHGFSFPAGLKAAGPEPRPAGGGPEGAALSQTARTGLIGGAAMAMNAML
jgi:hypothetical protein